METARPEAVGVNGKRLALIGQKMQRYCDEGKTAGVVALAARHGKIFYHEAWGKQNVETGTPMALDSIFRIYSMTKPIVSVALMMLFEEGHFHLNDPIAPYAADFQDLEVLNQDGSREKAAPITFWHLLTHTSGLSYGFFDEYMVEQMYRDAKLFARDLTLEGMVGQIGRLPLCFQPGTKWHYSVATDVVGYLIQVIADMPLGDFLQEKIIVPLGMVDTGYEIADEKLGRLTSLYGQMKPEDPYMKLLDAPETSFHRPPVINQRGGSGLLSTTGDYVKFAQMLANGGTYDGRRYIGRKTLDLMRRNHLPDLMLPLSISDPFPGYGFGLGFTQVIDETQVGMLSSLGNYGWSGAADTNYWVDPVEDLIGMTFMQYLPSQTIPVQQDFPNLLYQTLL